MKRICQKLTVWGLIFSLVLAMPGGYMTTVWAETYSGECGFYEDTVRWELDTKTGVLFISGNGEMSTRDYEQPWFGHRDSITEVRIESGVTEIGTSAFAHCKNLKRVSLPDSLFKIRDQAFRDCPALETIECSENTRFEFEEGCLYEKLWNETRKLLFCSEQKEGELELLDDITEIASYAFYYSNLTKVTISGEMNTISSNAFRYAGQLKEIHLNPGTRKIEDCAFYTEGLQGAWIPRSVTSIADDAFYTYKNDWLTIYGYPGSAAEAYAQKKGLAFEALADDMDEVEVAFDATGGEMYEASKRLYPMMMYGDLPVPTRDGFQFAGWHTMAQGGERVSATTILESETDVTLYAHWTKGEVYSGSVGTNGWDYLMDTETGTLSFCGQGDLLPEETFPHWIDLMDAEAWKDLVTEVVVGSGIFSFCNVYGNTQVNFSDFPNLKKVRLPDSMESIADVFWHCEKLEEINLSNHITELISAFSGCKSLTKIEVPGSVSTIRGAFDNCTALEEVILQEGVSSFWGGAFSGCTSLKYMYLPASFSESVNGFLDLSLERLEIAPDNPHFMTDGKVIYSKDGTKLIAVVSKPVGEYVIPDSVSELAKYAFSGCRQMTKIFIPDGVTEIPYDCFIFCDELKEVRLPQNLVKIGKRAFDSKGLERLDIPDSVTEIASDSICENVIIGCSTGSVAYEHARQFGMHYELRDTEMGMLKFDACGGTVEPSSKEITKGSSFCELPVPVREHYVFMGWYTEPNGGILVTEQTIFEAGGIQTVYAHWEGEKRWVNFDANGGELIGKQSKYLSYGEPYGTFPEIWREGYRMLGWYTEKEGGQKVTGETLSEADGVEWLYAHWEPAVTLRISFDPMGGVVSLANKSVVKGEPYGELPTPGRAGYVFCGWHTQAQGGVEVNSLSVAQNGGTLYARWKLLNPSYKVTFDANGGSASVAEKTVTYAGTYGELPVASRTGYRFDGWHTSRAGGTKIMADSVVAITEPQTLYAHWTANSYRVTFSPNGGTVEESGKTVTYGKAYGALPVPQRNGYVFDGWHTALGEGITEKSVYSVAADQTLYAHWHKQEMSNYSLKNLSYSFGNDTEAYHYPSNYRIDLKLYQMMYGNSQEAYWLYKNQGQWGGNCFGMTSTSCMMQTLENGIYPSSFQTGASSVSVLDIGDRSSDLGINVREFIEAMQISQSLSVIPYERGKNRGKIEEMCRAVQATGITGCPILLSLRGYWGGHSVAAYKYETVSADTARIYVYDPNYPKQERYVTIRSIDEETYALSYYVNDELWVTDYSFYPYDVYYQVWNSKGGSSDQMLFCLSSDNAELYDGSGALAARVIDGELVTEREDIYEFVSDGITSDGQSAEESAEMKLYLPPDAYTVKNTDPYEQEFEAEMLYGELAAEVVTDGEAAEFHLENGDGKNAVELPGEKGDAYEITLHSLSEKDKEMVCLSGIGDGSAVSVAQEDGAVSCSGGDAALEIEGEKYPSIAVTALAGAGGVISNAGKKEYQYKSCMEYRITPNGGYKISDVFVDGVSVGPVSRYGFADLTYPHTIEAKFVKINTGSVGNIPQKPKPVSAGSTGNISQKPKPGNPKGTSIAKIQARSKGFEVKWNKQKDEITGYQVQYSTNAKFKKSKTSSKKFGKSKTRAVIRKLKAEKRYYVRIRTYRKEGNTFYYSGWSRKKTVKTKK